MEKLGIYFENNFGISNYILSLVNEEKETIQMINALIRIIDIYLYQFLWKHEHLKGR